MRPLFLLTRFFCLVEILWFGSGGSCSGICGSGPPCPLSVEVFNVGCWLTHGDLALEAKIDFLAVVEHRLIPARVRSVG